MKKLAATFGKTTGSALGLLALNILLAYSAGIAYEQGRKTGQKMDEGFGGLVGGDWMTRAARASWIKAAAEARAQMRVPEPTGEKDRPRS